MLPFAERRDIEIQNKVVVQQAEAAPPGKTQVGHGIEDLSPAEQEAWLKELAKARQSGSSVTDARAYLESRAPAAPDIKFVRVAGPDYLSRGFAQAIAAEAEMNGHYKPVLDRITRMAKDIAKGFESQDRMEGTANKPQDIVVQR